MKQRFFAILLALALLLSGCAAQKSEPSADILATTAPVAQIVGAITAGTDLTVATLISEPVSCVHDYALSVDQMRAVEQAKHIVISGAGLEEFMADVLTSRAVIDASEGLALLPGEEGESDPHTWLAPENMIAMTHTVETALAAEYPQHAALFAENADSRLPMASTTKIMTALVALGEGDLDRVYTVKKQYAAVEGSSMYLEEGERLTLRDTLYGLLLSSGNDAAVAIADRILTLGEPAVADYKKFLSGGSSTDPISLLKIAGVDMSSPEPVNSALALFGELVDEMEQLV